MCRSSRRNVDIALKAILPYMLATVFSFNVLYADTHSRYIEKTIISSEEKKDINTVYEIKPSDLDFDISEVEQAYKKWKVLNTGTYTYICRPHSMMGRNVEAILAVKDDKIVLRMLLTKPYSKISVLHHTFHSVQNFSPKMRRDGSILRAHLNCNIDDIFNKVLHGYYKKSFYDNYKINIKYDTKYGFISDLVAKKLSTKVRLYTDSYSWDIHMYKLLMIPKNVQYTDETLRLILDKYKQTWECEKRLLSSKKTNDEQNLTLLEKAVGKEKLECLDRYLVWDENESK